MVSLATEPSVKDCFFVTVVISSILCGNTLCALLCFSLSLLHIPMYVQMTFPSGSSFHNTLL